MHAHSHALTHVHILGVAGVAREQRIFTSALKEITDPVTAVTNYNHIKV